MQQSDRHAANNRDDQTVVRRVLPDSLGGFGDLLPVPDTGEALVVGDAILLPTRIRIAKPRNEPLSGAIEFWDRWADSNTAAALDKGRRELATPDADDLMQPTGR
ncbi:hypothetical protein [Bradyrhizobium brasilense]|uniref:Uncharacterized protein n=1 Tax=Bradyrhizobium brasilense TaxID=1419277 RepID=A0ABY8JDJ1_9BRAD|nr:hypothetical protein [Bradyrhizobium brasilense]WFU62505.1 hypothetical protein QA636_34250 [Bradyrhizobium brasilense]